MVHITELPPIPSPSLADIIGHLQLNTTLALQQRRDMISALRTTARLFGLEPAALPADPRVLRQHFRTSSPAAGGFSRRRLDNLRSLVLSALRTSQVAVLPGRARTPLCPAWQALHSRLPDTTHRLGLSRFVRHCSALGVAPEAVEIATFAAFAAALESDSLVRQPAHVHRTTCRLWNSAGQRVPGWPALVAPVPESGRRRLKLTWEDVPASFLADADAFLHRKANPDPFADDYAKPVEPSTTRQRRKQILQLATALVSAGHPVAGITGLATLVQLSHAKSALRHLLDGKGGTKTTYLHGLALLLKAIAQHWVKVDAPHLEALRQLCQKLTVPRAGMTEKNQRLLRQFDNPKNVSALVHLPRQTFAQLARHDNGTRAAVLRAMNALAVEVLTMAPLRAENLTQLRFDQHIVTIRTGSTKTVHLVLTKDETKNDAPYELPLSPETVRLLDLYRTHYHPRLSQDPVSPWLFPNEAGHQRSIIAFSRGVCAFVRSGTGIGMNIHLFRHLAVKLHLTAYPDDLETPRRLLGHKNSAVTARVYAEVKNSAAFRRYDEVIRTLRYQATAPARRKAAVKEGRS